MNIKNCFRILLNNFVNVWKVLLYKAIVFVIGAGLCAGLVLPSVISIAANVATTGLFDRFGEVVSGFFTRGADFSTSVEALKSSAEAASLVLADNAGRLLVSYISIGVILLVTNLLSSMSGIASADIIDASMSSNAKYNFASRFIINFGKNIRYQLARLVTEVPLYSVLAVGLWFLFSTLFQFISVFSLVLTLAAGIVLVSAVQVPFMFWLPAVATGNQTTFKALKWSFRACGKRYAQLFSVYLLINLALLAVNIAVVFFTCGVGLAVTLPMSALFMVIFRTVNYYHQTGRKYYVAENVVVTPELPEQKEEDEEEEGFGR